MRCCWRNGRLHLEGSLPPPAHPNLTQIKGECWRVAALSPPPPSLLERRDSGGLCLPVLDLALCNWLFAKNWFQRTRSRAGAAAFFLPSLPPPRLPEGRNSSGLPPSRSLVGIVSSWPAGRKLPRDPCRSGGGWRGRGGVVQGGMIQIPGWLPPASPMATALCGVFHSTGVFLCFLLSGSLPLYLVFGGLHCCSLTNHASVQHTLLF